MSGPAFEIRCTLTAHRTGADPLALLPTWRRCP
jgi:hypothetical protein